MSRLPPYFVCHIERAQIMLNAAKERHAEKKHLQAYEYCSEALGNFDDDDVKNYPEVSDMVDKIRLEMDAIGQLRIFDIPFGFEEVAPCQSDPFCRCHGGPGSDHFCGICYSEHPITVKRVYVWKVQQEKEKLERERKLAVLVNLKSAEAPILQAKVEKMRKELELLEEALKCSSEEAMDAQEQLEASRGW